MQPSPTHRTLAFVLALLAGAALSACGGRQVRPPPDTFLVDAPVETGDRELDARVARAREIAELDPADFQALRKSVAAVGDGAHVETMMRHVLGKGDVDEALSILRAWAEATSYAEPAMANYLDLALGTDRLEECIVGTDEFLEAHEDHPFLLLIRGVCLQRFGRPDAGAAALYSGMAKIETLGGFTGVLERELGVATTPTQLSEIAQFQNRLGLIDYMTEFSVLGHVLVRHASGLTVEDAPPDPRLMDLGGITSSEVERIFTSRREAFRHCQLMYKKRRKIPGGRLVVHLTIRRDGSPGTIERVRDTFEVEEIPACIEEQIGHLWFPPPRYGKAVLLERDFRMLGD